MVKRKLIFILGSILFVCLVACDDSSDCRYLENRKVKMAFGKISAKKIADTTVSNITIEVPATKVKLYDSASANQVGLNLSQDADSSLYIMRIGNKTDTILCYYTRHLEMVSSECGFNTRFKVDSVLHTRNNINFIVELDGLVDKDVDKNYRIVLYTAVKDTSKTKKK